VNDETVLLELTDGVHAHFAKNAVATVLSEGEFNRIVHGIEPEEIEDADADDAVIEDDATPEVVSGSDDARPDLLKKGTEDGPVELSKAGEAQEQDGSGAGSK
jgi:preprotein translocase subunit YajC